MSYQLGPRMLARAPQIKALMLEGLDLGELILRVLDVADQAERDEYCAFGIQCLIVEINRMMEREADST